MRICNTIAVFLPGFCYLGLAFIPTDMPWLHIAMFSLIGITFASAGGGFYKCSAVYSRYKLGEFNNKVRLNASPLSLDNIPIS
jgi:hypothetical protein